MKEIEDKPPEVRREERRKLLERAKETWTEFERSHSKDKHVMKERRENEIDEIRWNATVYSPVTKIDERTGEKYCGSEQETIRLRFDQRGKPRDRDFER